MRIGCLQFAPRVGDVDNNLNRADAVLARANTDDLDGLDLLVVPELAFTGYNFKSLQHISPYLEHAGSGISSLWARTIALKHNCTVVVGYPEKVDVSDNWPTSPEYFNSAIVINNEGETIGNYRKHFLYMTDETWALEGKEFGNDFIPGLGQTAMGICMDINPYKFEAPWYAFEFAFHVLEVRANLVIISMAWLTREDPRSFSRMPLEPDMDTLTYWVQRMEPVIRAETDDEIIVIFCNRTGVEDDVVYAGTSAVIGIKEGEVNVYGILGRGEKNLLVVDTDQAPIGKLVNRPDEEVDAGDSAKVISPITGALPFSGLGTVVEKEDDETEMSNAPMQPAGQASCPSGTPAMKAMETPRLPLTDASKSKPQQSTLSKASSGSPPPLPSSTGSGRPSNSSIHSSTQSPRVTSPLPATSFGRPSGSPKKSTESSKREKLPPLETSFGTASAPPREVVPPSRRETFPAPGGQRFGQRVREKSTEDRRTRQRLPSEEISGMSSPTAPNVVPQSLGPEAAILQEFEVDVPSPRGPSPIPRSLRPEATTFRDPVPVNAISSAAVHPKVTHKASESGSYTDISQDPRFTPTDSLDGSGSSVPSSQTYWVASQPMIDTPITPTEPSAEPPASPMVPSAKTRRRSASHASKAAGKFEQTSSKTSTSRKLSKAQSMGNLTGSDKASFQKKTQPPIEQINSSKTHQGSKSESWSPMRSGKADQEPNGHSTDSDLAALSSLLGAVLWRPHSIAPEEHETHSNGNERKSRVDMDRPKSPKSRNLSRNTIRTIRPESRLSRVNNQDEIPIQLSPSLCSEPAENHNFILPDPRLGASPKLGPDERPSAARRRRERSRSISSLSPKARRIKSPSNLTQAARATRCTTASLNSQVGPNQSAAATFWDLMTPRSQSRASDRGRSQEAVSTATELSLPPTRGHIRSTGSISSTQRRADSLKESISNGLGAQIPSKARDPLAKASPSTQYSMTESKKDLPRSRASSRGGEGSAAELPSERKPASLPDNTKPGCRDSNSKVGAELNHRRVPSKARGRAPEASGGFSGELLKPIDYGGALRDTRMMISGSPICSPMSAVLPRYEGPDDIVAIISKISTHCGKNGRGNSPASPGDTTEYRYDVALPEGPLGTFVSRPCEPVPRQNGVDRTETVIPLPVSLTKSAVPKQARKLGKSTMVSSLESKRLKRHRSAAW